jgi:hypothetical protein
MEKFRDGVYVRCSGFNDNTYKIIFTHETNSEYDAKFDIIDVNSGFVGKDVYLYNGCWQPLSIIEMREYKLKRILK